MLFRSHQEDLAKQFGRFYKEKHGNGRTVCLLGMRPYGYDKDEEKELAVKEDEADMKRLKAALVAEMGKSCKAVCQQDGVNYIVTYNPVRKSSIDKDNLMRLKLDHPDIYEQYVTVSESRRFSVKIDTKAA